MTYLFVYGSLKRGFFSHKIIRDQQFIMEAKTQPAYKLYERHHLPVLKEVLENGVSVEGEIYLIEGTIMDKLDMYERTAGYDRFPIKLEGDNVPKLVEAYLYLGEIENAKDCGTSWP